ncbi:MAG: hypothetical protein SFZ03_04605 [Candidatus Melainabacteria bacterium]|nr:hypothetical protein [Candidatus Melainabacteria bacterium]
MPGQLMGLPPGTILGGGLMTSPFGGGVQGLGAGQVVDPSVLAALGMGQLGGLGVGQLGGFGAGQLGGFGTGQLGGLGMGQLGGLGMGQLGGLGMGQLGGLGAGAGQPLFFGNGGTFGVPSGGAFNGPGLQAGLAPGLVGSLPTFTPPFGTGTIFPTTLASMVNTGVPFLYSGLTHTADIAQFLIFNSSNQVLPVNTFQGQFSPALLGFTPLSVFQNPFGVGLG